MAVSGSLSGEVSMQLAQTASAKAKELSVSFYCSEPRSGPKPHEEGRKAFRRNKLKFTECGEMYFK